MCNVTHALCHLTSTHSRSPSLTCHIYTLSLTLAHIHTCHINTPSHDHTHVTSTHSRSPSLIYTHHIITHVSHQHTFAHPRSRTHISRDHTRVLSPTLSHPRSHKPQKAHPPNVFFFYGLCKSHYAWWRVVWCHAAEQPRGSNTERERERECVCVEARGCNRRGCNRGTDLIQVAVDILPDSLGVFAVHHKNAHLERDLCECVCVL